MDKPNKRIAYNFRNTCDKCFNDIEIPILGDFAYGEIIFQTRDAKDFYIAVLIDNKTFDFITEVLEQNKDLRNKEADALKVLALIADKVDGKEFSTNYPICPICKNRLRNYNDSNRTTTMELGYASWSNFESLSKGEKLDRLKQVIN